MNAQLFNEKIQELNHNLEDLGTRCAEAFNNALIALAEGDMERCRAIVAADDAIDERHMALHHECLSFLAEDNPIAVDLRFVGAALQIATDIERIGDHAVEIAYAVMAIGTDRAEATPAPLLNLANRTRTQLEGALRAFH
ncbi:MAG TPA: PhoU domain-containing protein, partial [Armatimonadota bacterium]|nr:PhoU domain-containing protein [Armatimonadota bacterium]